MVKNLAVRKNIYNFAVFKFTTVVEVKALPRNRKGIFYARLFTEKI